MTIGVRGPFLSADYLATGSILHAGSQSCRPARTRPVRHRRGSRPVDRQRDRPPSSGSCRSARDWSWRSRPARHGSRRTGRHRAPRLARSSWNTSQILRSRSSGCGCDLAHATQRSSATRSPRRRSGACGWAVPCRWAMIATPIRVSRCWWSTRSNRQLSG